MARTIDLRKTQKVIATVSTAGLATEAKQDAQIVQLGTESTTPPLGTKIMGWLQSLYTAFTARINTLGQKTMAESTPIVIASDQSAFKVNQGSPNVPASAWAVGIYDSAGLFRAEVDSLSRLLVSVENTLSATLVGGLITSRSIIQEIQTTGLYQGKTAYIFNLIGQRNGFTSTSALDGVKEYGNGVSDFAVTSNSTLDIISSSVNDTAAGTGVRTVKVTYINNSNNLVESAAITLNGTTLVTSVLTGVNQVLWMETATAGSGGVAAGNIRLRINGGVVEVEQITAGGNKSRSAIFMVPTGYTGYVINWRTSSINNDQDVRLRGQVNSLDRSLSTVFHYMSQKYTPLNTNIPAQPEIFLKVPALAKIKANTVSGGTASTVRCNVNILMAIIQN